MLGIRPGWLRTHRKAQRPAIGAFRSVDNASIFLSNKVPFPSTTLCPPPHACPTQATLVTNPENNPFIQLRPCWTRYAALRRPLPRSSPRLAGIALRRPRRAFCAAMIVEGLNWRSRRNTKSKAHCALHAQVPTGRISRRSGSWRRPLLRPSTRTCWTRSSFGGICFNRIFSLALQLAD